MGRVKYFKVYLKGELVKTAMDFTDAIKFIKVKNHKEAIDLGYSIKIVEV